MKILDSVRPDRQTVMFSATFPKQMEALARKSLHKPIEITIGGRSVVCKDVVQNVVCLISSSSSIDLILFYFLFRWFSTMIRNTWNYWSYWVSISLLARWSSSSINKSIAMSWWRTCWETRIRACHYMVASISTIVIRPWSISKVEICRWWSPPQSLHEVLTWKIWSWLSTTIVPIIMKTTFIVADVQAEQEKSATPTRFSNRIRTRVLGISCEHSKRREHQYRMNCVNSGMYTWREWKR